MRVTYVKAGTQSQTRKRRFASSFVEVLGPGLRRDDEEVA